MKIAFGTALLSPFVLLAALPPTQVLAGWVEDFESYPDGSPPGSPWSYSGSADRVVTSANSCEGASKAFRFQGPIGGCWESIPCRPLETDLTAGAVVFDFCVLISSNHVEGCHPWTGGVGLATTCSWTTAQGVSIVSFGYDGQMRSRIGILGPYDFDTWYQVRMTYVRVDPGTVRVSYWIDDVFRGSQDVVAASYEDDLVYFHGSSGDGAVWLDDIEVSSSPVPVDAVSFGEVKAMYR